MGLARLIAESDAWTLIHVVIVLGVILMFLGIVAIGHTIGGGLAEALARLGVYAAAVGTTLGLATVILDGVGAKQLADQWAAAPEPTKAVALSLVSMNVTLNFALAGLFNLSFAGVPLRRFSLDEKTRSSFTGSASEPGGATAGTPHPGSAPPSAAARARRRTPPVGWIEADGNAVHTPQHEPLKKLGLSLCVDWPPVLGRDGRRQRTRCGELLANAVKGQPHENSDTRFRIVVPAAGTGHGTLDGPATRCTLLDISGERRRP